MNQSFKAAVQRWNQPGPTGFWNWCDDIQPRILVRSGKYEPFQPTKQQRKFIDSLLKVDKAGNFVHTMAVNCQPRRHGKSTVFLLITLWLTTSRPHHTTQLLGSAEDHTKRVMFLPLVRTIANSPRLNRMIPESSRFAYTFECPALAARVQFAASNLSTSFGDRLNLIWVSDLHSHVDLAPFNAMQASLLDSEGSLCLIDANVDDEGGPVHALQMEAEHDKSIISQYTSYKNFAEYEKKAPPWIDRQKAARLQKTLLPAEFDRDILGKRSARKNGLFDIEIIKQCRDRYQTPVQDVAALTNGRAVKIGAGLDRAKSLIAGPRGDHSVWTVVAKVARPEGEPEFFLLNQVKFQINAARVIKAQVLEDHKRYGLDATILENFETADIHAWMVEQGINCELISPHEGPQNASFPEMHRVFKEGRFHLPTGMKDFESELQTFSYTRRKNGTYAFGHSSEKFHDDRVYSCNWAIHSLRREVMHAYELSAIMCMNRSSRRNVCFLMGGSLILPHCSRSCAAFEEVNEHYKQFMQFQPESELTLPEFFATHVRLAGPRLQQAV